LHAVSGIAHPARVPELPEVETLRRMLESRVTGRVVDTASRSRSKLHVSARGGALSTLVGRRIERIERRGKYLLFRLDADVTLLSHLGMSGRWLFYERDPAEPLDHVHARLRFRDGSALWFQDPRRFGQLRVLDAKQLERDLSLRRLGRDPLDPPLSGEALAALGDGSRASVKALLLDQGRIAGVGNIYASEILHRAAVDPRRQASSLALAEWNRVAAETVTVLREAISRMGTTFSMYRTIWNEPGQYGDQLRVYERGGEPCRTCGTPIRRIIQGQRSTYFCPHCQPRSGGSKRPRSTAPTR
jgi:formamidopyrimidine-DNA glycosylase